MPPLSAAGNKWSTDPETKEENRAKATAAGLFRNTQTCVPVNCMPWSWHHRTIIHQIQLMHNRAHTSVLWISYGRAALEHLRPGHCNFCSTFFFSPGNSVTVLQKNPHSFEEWKKLKDTCFWFELLLADKWGQPKFISGNIAWNNYQQYCKDPIQFYIGILF